MIIINTSTTTFTDDDYYSDASAQMEIVSDPETQEAETSEKKRNTQLKKVKEKERQNPVPKTQENKIETEEKNKGNIFRNNYFTFNSAIAFVSVDLIITL